MGCMCCKGFGRDDTKVASQFFVPFFMKEFIDRKKEVRDSHIGIRSIKHWFCVNIGQVFR